MRGESMIKNIGISFLIGLVLFFGCFVSEVFACRCVSDSNEIKTDVEKVLFKKNVDKAQAIFSGEVIEIDSHRVKFKVEKVWKGDVGKEFVMSTGTLKLEGNDEMRSSCDYEFEKGKSYLVFAEKLFFVQEKDEERVLPEYKKLLASYQCGWTKPLDKAKQGIKKLDQMKRQNK
jgi:hypothetical protein